MQEYKVTVDGYKTTKWHDLKTDQLHRVGAPACEYADGTKLWYLNGQLHRVDGPAVEYTDGYEEWWINGQKLTESEFNDRMNPKCDPTGQTVEIDGVKYKLIKA